MKLTVNFAIVGCGLISRLHLEAIKNIDDALLCGVYDVNASEAKETANKWNTKAYSTYEALVEDKDVDAVCICTPSFLHPSLAKQAIEAKKHVLIEKPVALTIKDCDMLIALGEKHGVQVGVVSQLRFSPAIHKIKSAIQDGLLGKLTRADLYMKYYRDQKYYDRGGWRGTWEKDGGGALMNQGIHGVDLLLYFMGSVKSIYAQYGTLVRDIEVEDTLSAVVRYDSGAIGVIEASTADWPGMPRYLEINGELGRIVMEEDRIVLFQVEGHKNYCLLEEEESEIGTHNDPSKISPIWHTKQLENFISAVRGDTDLLVDAWQGRAAVELVLASYQSQEKGMPIYLNK